MAMRENDQQNTAWFYLPEENSAQHRYKSNPVPNRCYICVAHAHT
jgi:hypothetical protein